jgi:hypothetical protein
MPFLLDDIVALLRTARRVRSDQGGGDTEEDEARRARIEAEEDDFDAEEDGD